MQQGRAAGRRPQRVLLRVLGRVLGRVVSCGPGAYRLLSPGWQPRGFARPARHPASKTGTLSIGRSPSGPLDWNDRSATSCVPLGFGYANFIVNFKF